jgi:hypothetical protein
LVIQQSLTYPAGDYFGFRIGDIDEWQLKIFL